MRKVSCSDCPVKEEVQMFDKELPSVGVAPTDKLIQYITGVFIIQIAQKPLREIHAVEYYVKSVHRAPLDVCADHDLEMPAFRPQFVVLLQIVADDISVSLFDY